MSLILSKDVKKVLRPVDKYITIKVCRPGHKIVQKD